MQRVTKLNKRDFQAQVTRIHNHGLPCTIVLTPGNAPKAPCSRGHTVVVSVRGRGVDHWKKSSLQQLPDSVDSSYVSRFIRCTACQVPC